MPESFSLEEVMGQQPQGPVDPELDKQIARYEQMPSKGKPFTAAAKYLNPNIPGHPEYNDEGKSPLQVLYQEREAQRKKGQPQGFSLEEVMGTKTPEPAPGEPDT